MPVANIFYFNPTCELAVANGSFSYMPPRLLQKFEHDCSVLPFVFSKSDDFVLTDKVPSAEFILKLTDLSFEMPNFCPLNELVSRKDESFGSVIPWGWSPAAHYILKDLKERCSPAFKESPVFNWVDEHKTLFERKTSLQFLNDFLKQNTQDFFIEEALTGIKVLSIEEIENLLNGYIPMVIKAPLSSSGRGIQIIRKSKLSNSNKHWITGILNHQKYLIAEPYLDKMADISFQFKIKNDSEPEYLGYSFFETSTNGQYKSSLIHPENESSSYSDIYIESESIIRTTAEKLKKLLNHSVYNHLYRGFLGIDALLYRDSKGLKIQPCIEINTRMNMGILSMFIERRIDQETTGKFVLFYGHEGEFQKFANEKVNEYPLKIRNGKLSSGFLSLIEPGAEKQFGAYILLKQSDTDKINFD